MKTKLLFVFLCFFVFASSVFAQQEARKFDEMGDPSCDDAKARLDNFGVQLQQDPTTKGYIIFYGRKSYRNTVYNKRAKRYMTAQILPRRGEARARMTPWIDYLISNRGLGASRVELIDGGYREESAMEFWIAPSGAKPPTPTPTLTEKEVKFRKGKVRASEFRCEV